MELSKLSAAALFAMGMSGALAADNKIVQTDGPLETVTIIGSKEDASRLAGAGEVITDEDLAKFQYTDIQRILGQVPGVYTRTEDGYGLRPNISIRGTYGDRSGKITLMEDGVLIAPAPYTASSAYYFPTTGRLAGVEVLKGPAAIEYGPYTVGGAINLISTPIPAEMSGEVTAEAGEDETYRLHASYGGSTENWGFLLEGHTHSSDGFYNIDNSNNNTGFQKDDLIAKLRYNSSPSVGVYQQLELKLQYSEEESQQTYVGLTESDFGGSPYRRYGLSREDVMDNEHKSATLTHVAEFTDTISLTTTAYYNEFQRNWYKTDKIDGEGIDEVITCANGGGCDGMSSNYGEYNPAFANAVLSGSAQADVYVKNNNREYESQGIQTRLAAAFNSGDWDHELGFGARYHEDEEGRNQPVDLYLQGTDGSFDLVDPGSSSDSLRQSDAWSLYAVDSISYGSWTIKPGLRYENYTIRDAENDELLPGLGLTYDIDESWQVLMGVHEGHSPSASADSDPETATNYEAGFRYRGSAATADVIAFYSDYDNIIGVCTNSGGAGGDCEAGDTENGGAAKVLGLEVQAGYTFALASGQLPLSASYTYTKAEFQSSFEGSIWGTVEEGDKLPNLPENQLSLNAGLYLDNGFGSDLSLRYFDETCSTAECKEFQNIDEFYTLDLSVHYSFNDSTRVYVNVDNLTDNDGDIISREPKAGARGQKPRTVMAGVRYRF
jgi:Fe(3+) dicitrate transport protein